MLLRGSAVVVVVAKVGNKIKVVETLGETFTLSKCKLM